MTVRVSRSAGRRALSLGLALMFLVAIVPMAPASAGAALDDNWIPGLPLTPHFDGSLDINPPTTFDGNDTFRVHMKAGERISFTLTHNPGVDLDLDMWSTNSTDFMAGGNLIWTASGGGSPQTGTFTAPNDGWFYLVVYTVTAPPVVTPYTLLSDRQWAASQAPGPVERLAGPDRYTTSVQIAEKNFPGWLNCNHVVLASGEDRAAADPLAASGLTWTYGAPILLTQESRVPPAVMGAIQGMQATAQSNVATLTVHVVGGPVSVPDERLAEIQAAAPGVIIDRVAPFSDRFVLAGAIAQRMNMERPGGFHRTNGYGQFALIANGADSDKFFDALALSPLTASTGYPILLVGENNVPSATWNALNSLGIQGRVVGGGPATVSNGVLDDLTSGGASVLRWWGSDRYSTATNIANEAAGAPPAWIEPHNVGVTAKLPDALTGGAFTGLRNGPVVLTQTETLPTATRQYLEAHKADVGNGYTLGGPASITPSTENAIRNSLIP